MLPTLSLRLAAMDMLCCMGLGFLVAALRVLLPLSGGIARFVADFCAVFVALILAQSYAAQSSSAGSLRLFMVVGLALGAFVFVKIIAPILVFFFGVAGCVLAFPLRIISHKLLKPAFLGIKRCIVAQKEKIKVKKAQKPPKKQLQNQAVLLYNSNVDL